MPCKFYENTENAILTDQRKPIKPSMKKFLLLSGALAVAVAAQGATPRTAEDFVKKAQQRFEQAKKGPRSANEQGKWLPGTLTEYSWNSWETNDWEKQATTKFTYNDFGQKVKEENPDMVRTYEYTPKGQIAVEEYTYSYGGGNKTEYTYDEVTGKEIGSTSYYLDGDKWVLSEKWELRITRDEKGNITRIDDYSSDYETKEMKLSGYRVYTYGTDGKISEIINYDIDEGEAEVEFHLKDIVWENTNGQLIIDDTNDMDADDYCMGDNRVKSGTLLDFDGDEGVTAYMTAEYPGNLGDLKMKMTINNTVFYVYEYSVLDAYGSTSEYNEELDYDVDGTTVTFTGDKYIDKNTDKYDSYGILVESISEEQSSYYSGISKSVADVTYDPTYGYPTEVVFKYSYNDEPMQMQSRQVYGDYALYSGVEAPVVDENAPVEYYNLQGVRVANPSNGIYIRRQGTAVSKVMIR